MKGKINLQKKVFFFFTFIVITLLATTIYALESITTSKYIVKNDVIMRIDAGTTVEQFLNNVGVNSGASKAIYRGSTQLNGSDLLGTGMTLKVGNDTTYNLAVRGDANGDAKITATDLSLFKTHATNIQLLEGIYEKAIDINCDLKVSMVDLSLLKMILVGLPLPDSDIPNINGDITILPSTTNYVKELDINVYWPEDTTGLTKQISLDNGATYSNYTGNVTMRANSTVIARLVDQNSRVVKSASLVVTNIDNEAPANFEVAVEHKITNYTTLTGETTDAVSGLAGYHFTYNAGQSWVPVAGQINGTFVFTNVPANTRINLQMKATDRVGNYKLTNTVEKRTFKSGIDILSEKLQEVAVDTEAQSITMPDGRVFRLAITEEYGYAIICVGTESDLQLQLEEEQRINEKIAEYEVNGAISVNDILIKITEDALGNGNIAEQILITENAKGYNQYIIEIKEDGRHVAKFLQTVLKNGLTASGQDAEVETLNGLSELITEMKTQAGVKIIDILDRAVTDGILLEENVNRNNGRFETEVGMVYEILAEDDYEISLIGLAKEVEDGYIEKKLLSVLEEGLKNQIIDWAIEDGLTTEAKASRVNGIYEANNGSYKQVVIDMQKGIYETVQIEKIEGAIIEYTLTPDFPTMTNKTVLNVTARGTVGITKIEIFTELGDALLSKTYSDNQLTKSENIDITYNGIYLVKVTTSDGKVSTKEILVSNIASILPIKVTINPETPRNTTATGIQNDVVTGPISVTLEYSEAPLLENTDKYQYQLYDTTGAWQTATKEQLIENITTNCKIYARYFDGVKSIKQIEIVIDTVDNVAPDAFAFTTIVNSNTISVNAETVDTAKDSNGVVSRNGVAGIEKYMYKMDAGEWQTDNVFSNLVQNTSHTIIVKAIDYAGNETNATNNGATVTTAVVPSANSTISFDYSTTQLTKENVLVKFISTLTDETYTIQYQAISDGSQPVSDRWTSAKEYEAIGNCKIYVRLVDSTNQENPGKNYAIGEVANIDNMGPIAFTPKATATTKNSITIKASSVGTGEAKDTPATNTTACSGTVKYDYYITGTAGMTTKIENQTNHTYTFTGLEQGSLYSIFVIATDAVGNSTVSQSVTVVTNGTLNEYANAHTTITGLREDAAYNNPIIPVGFAPVNEGGAEWGDGTTIPSGWNDGLVIRDRDGNEFVWIPVDGTNVTYTKWLTQGIPYSQVTDGENVLVNGVELSEDAQIQEFGGFYVSRTEASKNGTTPESKVGETPWTGNNYSNAKEKAESMYSSNLLQSALVTGTQWDTMMKWLSNDSELVNVLASTSYGNFTNTRKNTGNSETYKLNNIFDLSGNVQEITNELQGNNVVVRGGAYDLSKYLSERYTYSQEYANSNLGFRMVLYVIETDELEPTNPGTLGIGNINKGPGNITINGGEPSYLNPVVPVGFKAINTPDAKWFGLPTPKDWNKGLVIEDIDGNQFVWVPVDGNIVKYEKWYTIFALSSIKAEAITGDLLPLALEELGVEEKQQVETYGGFYVARYEAGNFEGTLASKTGTRTVSAVTYAEAREYAEEMYSNAYVKSGLLTGTAWDTTMKWMANSHTENRVLKDKTSGNNPDATFIFSGEYAEGPNSTAEKRGAYKTGTNVEKAVGSKMLLATGLVEYFKTNNIYDMAGNVWEYTYEYTINKKGEEEYIARGADYYRNYFPNAKWGAAIRENIVTSVAEKRNEGGFRVMLYLVEGTAEIGKYEDFNRTMTGKPSTYDNPVIPAGFAPVNKGASWGNGTKETIEWNNGLVIDDQAGNEFVWVPVDRTNVEYKNWLQTGISYKEVDGQEIPEKVTGWKEKEITQVNKYGGFYIARYEASRLTTETETTGGSIANSEAWTNLDYVTAKSMAEKMKTKDNVSAGLVTGTAWDTTMKWIANEKGNVSYVAENSTTWGYYSNSTLGKNAQAKNIFLLAGGNWEWTAEKLGSSVVYRGGVRTDRGDSSPAGYRGTKGTTTIDGGTTFRMMLYVTGDVLGAVTKPVSDSEPQFGTKFPTALNQPVLSDGMTPVKWTGSVWQVTNENDPDWYSYEDTTIKGANTSKWANAKTPDGTMFVWIPRYAMDQNYDIKFLIYDSNITATGEGLNGYSIPVAFRNAVSSGGWDKELTGLWIAKYEQGGYAAKTGAAGFRQAQGLGLGMNSTQRAKIDTHMAKNSEWLACANLGYSKYGVNKISNTPESTTNNPTGVYQMSSGRDEYVATIGSYNSTYSAYGRLENIDSFTWANPKYVERTTIKDGGRTPLLDHNSLFGTIFKCANSNVQNSYRLILIVK